MARTLRGATWATRRLEVNRCRNLAPKQAREAARLQHKNPTRQPRVCVFVCGTADVTAVGLRGREPPIPASLLTLLASRLAASSPSVKNLETAAATFPSHLTQPTIMLIWTYLPQTAQLIFSSWL